MVSDEAARDQERGYEQYLANEALADELGEVQRAAERREDERREREELRRTFERVEAERREREQQVRSADYAYNAYRVESTEEKTHRECRDAVWELGFRPVNEGIRKLGLDRDLRLNDKGSGVKNLQRFLISQDLGPAARRLGRKGATGNFGTLTLDAVKELQKNLKLPRTGFLGKKTREQAPILAARAKHLRAKLAAKAEQAARDAHFFQARQAEELAERERAEWQRPLKWVGAILAIVVLGVFWKVVAMVVLTIVVICLLGWFCACRGIG